MSTPTRYYDAKVEKKIKNFNNMKEFDYQALIHGESLTVFHVLDV